MSDEYARGYAAGLRELDHGLSYAEVERLRAAEGRYRTALEQIKELIVPMHLTDEHVANRMRKIASEALSHSGEQPGPSKSSMGLMLKDSIKDQKGKQKCIYCNGTGVEPIHFTECRPCEGSGEQKEETE